MKIKKVLSVAVGSPYPYIEVKTSDNKTIQLDFEEFFNYLLTKKLKKETDEK